MCNYKREDAKGIPKTGMGFKIVLTDYMEGEWGVEWKGEWESPITRATLSKHNVWNEGYSHKGRECGFCFFMTFSDANILLNELLSREMCKIVEIEYKGGICMQDERYNRSIYNSCLCKEFTFIDYPFEDNKED